MLSLILLLGGRRAGREHFDSPDMIEYQPSRIEIQNQTAEERPYESGDYDGPVVQSNGKQGGADVIGCRRKSDAELKGEIVQRGPVPLFGWCRFQVDITPFSIFLRRAIVVILGILHFDGIMGFGEERSHDGGSSWWRREYRTYCERSRSYIHAYIATQVVSSMCVSPISKS